MINFFKKYRKVMVMENNIARYLRYAIGEIVLVVIGILIALQINNWNENRKQNNERNELINSLISDFKETRARMAAIEVENELSIKKTSRFLSLAYTDNQSVSIDSLKYYFSGTFQFPFFEPNLTSYNQAVSTGKIGLIKDKDFLKHISDFFTAFNIYKHEKELSGQIFYSGSIWELRKELGNLVSLAGSSRSFNGTRTIFPEAYKLSDDDYRTFIKKPLVFAAVDNMQTIFYNVKKSFKNMDEASKSIIKELE